MSKVPLYDVGMTIGKRIKESRKRHGMTQADVAEAIGVSEQAVSQWERDETNLTADNLVKLSSHFGVSTNWLWTGEGDPDGLNGLMEGFTAAEREAVESICDVIRARRARSA